MLKLQNVCKTYVTKSKVETHALSDVNLEIADRGMVFILGKSGSGKSTLLNLLGGLDAPTSGEIFVDGVSMQKFSPRDYADYRNNYLGFVFQEFNLLADFNVRDNVALALRLNRVENENEKVSAALKQVELNETYLSRRIDEMSGGEKQRIAIARALIKDSKLILADEPTGNLDSATSESIWNILKTLSKECLVVVVSHDRESAEKYADRTIEIADGKVISDVGAQSAVSAETAKYVDATKNADKQAVADTAEPQSTARHAKKSASNLSFANRLKMGWRNLSLHRGKTAGVILVAVFCILAIILTEMCLCYSPEAALAKHIAREHIDYFTVGQGDVDEDNVFSPSPHTYKYSTKQYIVNHSRYIQNGQIECKQDILDFGLAFVGEALELDDNSYYTTTEVLKFYYQYNGSFKIDGENVNLSEETHPIQSLVGKKINMGGSMNSDEFILAGVIDTENVVNISALPQFFYRKNFDGISRISSVSLNSRSEDTVLRVGNNKFDGRMKIADMNAYAINPNTNVILTANGICSSANDLNLADNEIVLPYEIYSEVFDADEKWSYVSDTLKEVYNVPKEIGQTYSLQFYKNTGELFVDYGEVKLAGVSFTNVKQTFEYKRQIGVNENFMRQIGNDFDTTPITVQTSSIKSLFLFASVLRTFHGGAVTNAGTVSVADSEYGADVSELVYSFEGNMKYMSVVFMGIGAALLIVLVLLVINLISFSITARKKEIGILSAIGASNKDVTSIFLLETAIISAICFVIVLTLSLTFVAVLNNVFSEMFLLNNAFPFFRVDILTVVILALASFGLLLLAALIPLRKIIKLKPIDAIRNN